MGRRILSLCALCALSCFTAPATVILDLPYGTGAEITDTDEVQEGRIGRDGIASAWGGAKTFPGIFEIGPHYYDRYDFGGNYATITYWQVILDDLDSTGDVFAVGYVGGFDPTNIQAGYYGDGGSSPDFFFPTFFQVEVPAFQIFTVIVHKVSAGPPVAPLAYGILVEGFGTTSFDDLPDPAPIPEPSTAILMGAGICGILFFGNRGRLRFRFFRRH